MPKDTNSNDDKRKKEDANYRPNKKQKGLEKKRRKQTEKNRFER